MPPAGEPPQDLAQRQREPRSVVGLPHRRVVVGGMKLLEPLARDLTPERPGQRQQGGVDVQC